MYDIFNCHDSRSGLQICDDVGSDERSTLDVLLFYVVFGSVTVCVGDERTVLHNDDFIIVNSGERYRLKKGAGDVILCKVDIPLHILQGMSSGAVLRFEANSARNPALNHAQLRDTINDLLMAVASEQGVSDFRYFELGYRLLDCLVSNYAIRADDDEGSRIDQILSYIYSLYNTRLSLTDVASHFYMSSSYFSRYFKSETGENFISFLNRIRLEQAVEDLKSTDKTITSIAFDHGFASTSAFNKSFRESYGDSPSNFRAEYCSQQPQEESQVDSERPLEQLRNMDLSPSSSAVSMREVAIDVLERHPYILKPNRTVGMGPIYNLTTTAIQQQVLKIRKSLRLRYLRVTDVFGEEMVYVEQGRPSLSYDKVDQIFDFLMENRIDVLIDLDTPRLAGHDLAAAGDEEFETYVQALCGLLRQLLSHIINEFSLRKTLSYQFELGNSSRVSTQRYVRLAEAVRATLDSYSTSFMMGGPGFEVGRDDPELFRAMEDAGVSLDFVSMHSYAVSDDSPIEDLLDNHRLREDVDCVKALVRGTSYESRPLYVTEWLFTRAPHDYVNDACFMGAFTARAVQSVVDDVDVLVYGRLTDAAEEKRNSCLLLDGLPGLMSTQGIYKPAFFGVKFFHHMYANVLKNEHDYFVTANDNNDVAIICNNCCSIEPAVYHQGEALCLNDVDKLFRGQSKAYRFMVSGLANGTYKICSYSVNQGYGSLLDEWREWDFMDSLSSGDVNQLLKETTPHEKIKRVEVDHGTLTLDVELEPNQLTMIQCDHLAT